MTELRKKVCACAHLMVALMMWIVSTTSHASIEEALASAEDRRGNLAALVSALEQARGESGGSLSDLVDRLNSSAAPRAQVLATLASLLPASHRLEARRYQPRTAMLRPKPAGTVKPTPELVSAQPFAVSWLTSAPPLVETHRTGWIEMRNDEARWDGDRELNPFDSRSRHLTLGGDTQKGDWLLGVWAGYSKSELDSGVLGTDDQSTTSAGISAMRLIGMHSISFGLSHQVSDVDRTRVLLIDAAETSRWLPLRSSFNTRASTAALGYGSILNVRDAFSIAPSIGISATHLETGRYAERGSERLALNVATSDVDEVLASVGVDISSQRYAGRWLLLPSFGVTWEQPLRADRLVTTSQFNQTRFSFVTRGTQSDSHRWLTHAGVTASHESLLTLRLSASGIRTASYRQWAASLAVEFPF